MEKKKRLPVCYFHLATESRMLNPLNKGLLENREFVRCQKITVQMGMGRTMFTRE